MSQIYDSLKGLITSDRMSKASETLGESKEKLSNATMTILPAVLAMLTKKSNTPQVKEVIEMAGKKKTIDNVDQIFEGHGITDGVNIGERFTNALFGDKNAEFSSAIAAKAGIEHESADRLSTWICALVAGFFGNKVISGNANLSGLMGDLGRERNIFEKDIPSNIMSKLGLASVMAGGTAKITEKPKTTIPEKPKKGSGWITWLIIIILLLLLFLWWRSCNKNRLNRIVTTTEQKVDSVLNEPSIVVNRNIPRVAVILPDGNSLSAYQGGAEEQMVAFLKSEKFKTATLADFKNNWFRFDNVQFKHNSTSEFYNGSTSSEQLDNIATIMKNFPDTKIRLAGYADATGRESVNMRISEARANFIRSYLAAKGIDANRVITEGFGEEFAVYPPDAPDIQRATDRDIALRFTK